MKKSKRFTLVCVIAVLLALITAIIAGAVIYDAGGSDTSGSSQKGSKYTTPEGNTSDYEIAGVRVSVVNVYTGETRGISRNILASNTDKNRLGFTQCYNKVQMLNCNDFNLAAYNSLYTNAGTYGVWDIIGYRSGSLSKWENEDNLKYVADMILNNTRANADSGKQLGEILTPGDRILVEPLYPMTIKGYGYLFTVSEYATFCMQKYSELYDSNGTVKSGTSTDSILFIGNPLGRYYPTGVFAPEGSLEGCPKDCRIIKATALSGRTTYYNLMHYAYGLHIAYTDARPNNVTFTVNEVFNIVSDDGLSVTGDTQIYSNSFTVASGSTINIVDYLSTTRLAGNRNGDWPAWPRAGVTISANGTTYSNPWSYRFDGSWANGLTGHSSNVNQQYVIGSDGITITVRYVPNDAHLTIRNKVATESVNIQ